MTSDEQRDPHGLCSCCLSLSYIESILRYQLDTYERGSDAWVWASDLMDEVGK